MEIELKKSTYEAYWIIGIGTEKLNKLIYDADLYLLLLSYGANNDSEITFSRAIYYGDTCFIFIDNLKLTVIWI